VDVADEPVLDRFPMREEGGEIRREFVEKIARAIQADDAPFLRAVVAEAARGRSRRFDRGTRAGRSRPAGRTHRTDFHFSALNEVDDTVRRGILEELEPETVAEGVRELESDDAVELLEALDEEDQEEILEKLPPLERDGARAQPRLSGKFRGPADARPNSSRCRRTGPWGRRSTTCARRRISRTGSTKSTRVDAAKHWKGALPLDVLLRSRRPVPLADLVDQERRRVAVTDDLEEVARCSGKYNLVAAPVVDPEDRLVGVITIDDVVDVIEEEADEEIKALGGVTSDEQLSDDVWPSPRLRFNWLLVNLATAFSGLLGAWPVRKGNWKRWWRSRCWRRSSQARAQCRDPDHDGRGAGACDPRTRLQQRISRRGP